MRTGFYEKESRGYKTLKDERFIMKVVKMHYKNGMSQVEIGKRLNVSRMTVARALEQARKEGYVEIKLNFPENSVTDEEEILESKYHLKEAIIAYPREGKIADEVGFLASDYIIRVLQDHMTIALSNGTTLSTVADYINEDMRLRMKKYKDVKVVPLSGFNNISEQVDEDYRRDYSNRIIDTIAEILKVTAHQIVAPMIVADKEARDKFMQEASVHQVVEMAENADVAIFGIGSIHNNARAVNTHVVPEGVYEGLAEQGGIGETVCHVFDKDGELVHSAFDDRLVCVPYEAMKKIPVRVGVAYGDEKKEAIYGALKGGLINVLITDMDVAKYLIDRP